MRPLRYRRGERGIALLTAIVLVAVAAVVATAIGFASAMSARRASTMFGADQSLLAAEGAEAMAAYVLKQNGSGSQHDSLDQPWAMTYGPVSLADGLTLEYAQIEDQQGKFNLNNLAPNGTADTNAITVFERLLSALQLEPKWASLIADWIDRDEEPLSDGAEDSVYLSQSPPYRTANIPISSITELLALPGFGRDRFNRLAPYVAALPAGTTINVCTASGVLLDALSGKSEYSQDAKTLSTPRSNGCFPTLSDFQTSLDTDIKAQVASLLGQTTGWFRLRTVIAIGSTPFTLYSLLQRDSTGQIRPIIRTFGTE